MANVERRLDKLEQTQTASELSVVVWGDGDATAAVAAARHNNNWPDTASYTVRVMRVRWQRPDEQERAL